MKKFILIYCPLALFALLLAACSFKSIYNRLDYLIVDYVSDMVELDDVLSRRVEKRSSALLDWHRSTQLPEYAAWLRQLQADMNPSLDQARVQQHFEQAYDFWKMLSQRASDEMAALLPLLDEQQRLDLYRNIADRNDEFREEYIDLDEAEMRQSNRERLEQTFEEWFGLITPGQGMQLRQASKELVSTAPEQLMRRLRWQQGIREILEGAGDIQQKTAALNDFFSRFIAGANTGKAGTVTVNDATAELDSRHALNRRVIAQLIVFFARSLTPEQKAFFIDRTSDYIRILGELTDER